MVDRPTTKRRLGRGLESLLSRTVTIDAPPPTSNADTPAPPTPPASPASPIATSTAPPAAISVPHSRNDEHPDEAEGAIQRLRVADIHPNPRQPRRQFDAAALRSLADSIRSAGVMQPIVVRPDAAGAYEIVAGERRWRAVGELGLATIPAIVRDLDDRTVAEWSIIENVQREDLNPIERADAFQRLVREFGLTHEDVAQRVGLDRASVTNHLRLCELDPEVRELLSSSTLTMGHGRALLAISEVTVRQALAKKCASADWSVRELERRIRTFLSPRAPATASTGINASRAHMDDLERQVGAHLGTKVHIRTGRKKGTGSLTIDFFDLDQFEGLLERMGFRAR